MSRLYNLARIHTATLGTVSLIDLGNAVTGFLTFALAGVTDGTTVSYAINDPRGGGSEVGSGVYHSSGPSFTRTTVEKSSDGTSRISLSVNAEIMIAPSAADLNLLYEPELIAFSSLIDLSASSISPESNDLLALGTASKKWADLFLALGAVINWNGGDVTLTHAANALAFAGASSGYSFDAIVSGTDAVLTSGLRVGFVGTPTADVIQVGDANFRIDFNTGTSPFLGFDSGDFLVYSRVANQFLFQIGSATQVGIGAGLIFPNTNDGVAIGTGSLSFSDLFLATGGVINWNNSDVTITHSANGLIFKTGSGLAAPTLDTTTASDTGPTISERLDSRGRHLVSVGDPSGVTTGQGYQPSKPMKIPGQPITQDSAFNLTGTYTASGQFNSMLSSTTYANGTGQDIISILGTNVGMVSGSGGAGLVGNFIGDVSGAIGVGIEAEADAFAASVTAYALSLQSGGSNQSSHPISAYMRIVTGCSGDNRNQPPYAILLAGNGQNPVTTTGTLLGAINSGEVSCSFGIDLSNCTFATAAFKSTGFLVNGSGNPSFLSGTAIPAGGTAGAGLKLSSTANYGVFFGSGAPSLSAAKGSLYLRSDGSGINDRMYVNTNGSTAWAAIVTAS